MCYCDSIFTPDIIRIRANDGILRNGNVNRFNPIPFSQIRAKTNHQIIYEVRKGFIAYFSWQTTKTIYEKKYIIIMLFKNISEYCMWLSIVWIMVNHHILKILIIPVDNSALHNEYDPL